jgi:hypothetical protein
MADVFISYSQRSVDPTRELAEELRRRGIDVWWDARLTSGQRFDDVIRQELEAADAAIVIWTPESVTSQYVRIEAGIAYAWEKLITVRTADLPVSDIPGPFRTLHTDLVTDIDRIMVALGERGVQAKSAPTYRKMSKGDVLSAIGKLEPSLPAALEAFLRECQRESFRITTKRSLMIKALISNFGEVNFATIFPDGRVHTNYISESSERISDETIAADYLNGLASLIDGATVRRDGKSWTWRVELFGELPTLSCILPHATAWIELMKVARWRFTQASNARLLGKAP